MAFAVEADVVKALRRALTTDEQTYVDDVIAEAEDLILGYLGCNPTDATATPTVPAPVTRIAARMVVRVFKQDDGRAIGSTQGQQSAGPFSEGVSYTAGSTTGSPWLAATDKVTLRPYRCGGGMRSYMFGSERAYDETVLDGLS